MEAPPPRQVEVLHPLFITSVRRVRLIGYG